MKLTIPLAELPSRIHEIPTGKDCYVISILSSSGEELGAVYDPYTPQVPIPDEGVFPIPYITDHFPPVQDARSYDVDNWEYQYGGPTCRIGNNTPAVESDISFIFVYGEGTFDDCLRHLGDSLYCVCCGQKISGWVSDCLARRAFALASSVQMGEKELAAHHAGVILERHLPSEHQLKMAGVARPEEW